MMQRKQKKENKTTLVKENGIREDESNMDRKLLVWLLTGLVLCAGVALIGVGISFLVKYTNSDVTCDSLQTHEYEVYFDPTYLRLAYNRVHDQRTMLSVHMGQTPSGNAILSSYPRTVQACDAVQPVCSTVTYTVENIQAELTLNVKKINTAIEDVTCFETTWSTNSDDVMPTDCFPMSDIWFGGAEMYYQDWPVNSWGKHMSFYLSGDMFADPQQYGSVLERYWLSSQGVALFVPANVPLHVSIEKNQICFKGAYEIPAYKIRDKDRASHWLSYTTCMGRTPQSVHDYMFKTYFQRPTSLPDIRMMKSPIWSTWARYKIFINESVIMQYAKEILENNFTNSQLEIDDGYETRYGDFTFDSKKFPNASKMIENLHDLGFRVTTWVTPFMNPRSRNYDNGDANKYFILNGDTDQSGKVPWWNGVGASVDFTNTAACDWYYNILEDVRTQYGVDSFKFDAGETNYVWTIPNFKTHQSLDNVGYYTKYYAECAHRLGTQIEVRSAWNSQHLPIFVRMMDKDSNWSREKGLKTLIPTALTFSLLGYPYILPDMIGGNAYEDGFHGSPLPERELFIRWLELTAFLPSMQFSYVPWQYDDVTSNLARYYVTLHETVVFAELEKASREYVAGESGMGPIRPVWWVTLDDVIAFSVDDEFMVGDRYLVAPVVENATRARDVYLPGPLWRDGSRRIVWLDRLRPGASYLGGITLQDYPVGLEEISWWELTLIWTDSDF